MNLEGDKRLNLQLRLDFSSDRHIKPWHKRSSTLRKATAG